MPPPGSHPNPIAGPGDYTTTGTVHDDTYASIAPHPTDLSGRSVLITGASRGIGRAIAVSFARAGASYIALGARGDLDGTLAEVRTAADEIRGDGGREGQAPTRIVAWKLDVGDEASVRAVVEGIGRETGGRLDVLVNNAGVLDGRGRVGEGEAEGWWRNLDVNVRGPYLVARACLPLLLKGELKAIATVSSVGAHCVNSGLSGYQISKLAVVRLMEFIAAEYAEEGIMAISVHPGNVLTDIVGHGEGMDEGLKAVFTETPQLCADSLVYLTKENRPWLSGRYVNVTWDLPELTSDPKKAEIIEKDQLKVRLVV